MLVSVIIPAYNAQDFIEDCLNSVYNQTYDLSKLEVIVINDGSTDNTAPILNRLQKRRGFILKHTSNKGASAAREKGRQLSTGDYIQYLDSDDLLMPDKIEKQVNILKNNDGDVAYGAYDLFRIIENGEAKMVRTVYPKRLNDSIEIDTILSFWLPPAALMYSRRIVDKIGSWHPNLPVTQDARYLQEAAFRGGRFLETKGIVAEKLIFREDALSNINKTQYHKDILMNATEIFELWKDNLTTERKEALMQVFSQSARSLIELDKDSFRLAVKYLKILSGNKRYIPKQPKSLNIVSKMIGYENAERIALFIRKTKLSLK